MQLRLLVEELEIDLFERKVNLSTPVPGLTAMALEGPKTPGELALVLEATTLITGDLIRAQETSRLCLLPDQKLTDKEMAIVSLRRLADLPLIETVLTGDGWPVFRGCAKALAELAAEFD